MKQTLITLVMAAMLAMTAVVPIQAQTITPTGMSQGDLVTVLQRVVNALGAGVGGTQLTAVPASSLASMAFADGTAALPSVSFAADLNTGLYRVGTDILGFSTNGTARALINSSGNVTIGETDLASTTSKLYVDGVIAASNIVNCNRSTFEGVHFSANYGASTRTHSWRALRLAANNSSGVVSEYASILGYIEDNEASSHSGKIFINTTYNNTPTTAFIINDSQNVSLAATDLALTTAKAHIGGVTRIAGTIAGAAVTNPVLQMQFYDETGGATMTLPTAPAAGRINVFAVKTTAGVHSLRFHMPDNSTVEVALVP